MQFRLATLLLAITVVATSLNLAGGWWGVLLAAYSLAIVAACREGAAGGAWAPLLAILSSSGCLLCLLTPQPGSGEAPPRSQCANNLKQLGLGLHNYCERHGAFPPLAMGTKGQYPASWRVRVLPFVEHEPLYLVYRFDEPWNGSGNARLSARMPLYLCPSSPESRGGAATNYVAIDWSEAPWGKPPQKGPPRAMVVEAVGAGIAWLEPKDLPIETALEGINGEKAGGFASKHPGGAHLLLSDGAVLFVSNKVSPRLLRRLLTEPVDDELKEEVRSLAAPHAPPPLPRILAWLSSLAAISAYVTPAALRQRKKQALAALAAANAAAPATAEKRTSGHETEGAD